MPFDVEAFTHEAIRLVEQEDRRAWRRGLRDALGRAVERLGLAWSALSLVALLLWVLPMSTRAA